MGDEENSSNVKDIIIATTGLVEAVPIYQDLVQPAAKEIGMALGTVAKTVNIALAPISGMIWSYETIKDFVSNRVSEKLQNTPIEDIATPNPTIAGPLLEALKYTAQEDTLREMYANLLANALDVKTKDDAHPSFVEIIKQLSPAEAQLLLFLSEQEIYPEVCTSSEQQSIRGGGFWGSRRSEITSNKVKQVFFQLCSEFESNIDVNSALDNYRRLQILDIESNTNQSLRESFRGFHSREDKASEQITLDIKHTEKLFFTSFGMKFIQICVNNKS